MVAPAYRRVYQPAVLAPVYVPPPRIVVVPAPVYRLSAGGTRTGTTATTTAGSSIRDERYPVIVRFHTAKSKLSTVSGIRLNIAQNREMSPNT